MDGKNNSRVEKTCLYVKQRSHSEPARTGVYHVPRMHMTHSTITVYHLISETCRPRKIYERTMY